uniref:hypothetical protein n=1 Tax=Liquorilactobacillus sicerae TaxID=1416943 RepID=UPI00248097AF
QLFVDTAEFQIGNFNHKNIIKPIPCTQKFEVLNQRIEEMQLNNFILIMDIATFLYPKFDDDPDGTYRNSIDHGKSSPDKWTKDSYLNVLAAVLRLQSAVRLEGKRESDNKK